MAIPHAVPGEPLDVRPFASGLGAQKTVALFKARDLEVMRLVLLEGKSLPPHKVPGEVTIQCVEGSLAVEFDGQTRVLNAGELLFLSRGALHAVKALSDASALVTIALTP